MEQPAPFQPPLRAEGSGDLDVGKHLKLERRAKRFDPGRKFGALQGRTSLHVRNKGFIWSHYGGVPDFEVCEMKVERPQSEEGTALSKLEVEGDQWPDLLTSTPVKHGVAEELCEVLEKLCVASSIRRHPEHPDFALRVYELPVAGIRAASQQAKKESQLPLMAVPSRQAPFAEPNPFAMLATGPPEDVLEPSLLKHSKLSWSGCAELPKAFRDRARGPQPLLPREAAIRYPTAAHCHNLSERHCWIQDDPEAYLEVDLGANCHVTHVSTMGRFPPRKKYPHHDLWQKWLKEYPEWAKTKMQQWNVVDPSGRGWGQWVTRYELQARLEGGRAWESIATLKGNSDMTTEVAHDLREICHSPQGLQCRFLRFRPMGCQKKPAMRIGVYGNSMAREAANAAKKEDEERVRYIVPVPLSNRNTRRHQRDFASLRHFSPEWYGKYGEDYPIQRRRRIRARETLIDAREAMDNMEPQLDGQSSAEDCDADGPRAAAQQAEGAPKELICAEAEEPAKPRLQRELSRRAEEALKDPPMLVRTQTDEQRGYCSEPEEFQVDASDWLSVEQAVSQPPVLIRTRTDEERGYCSEPEEPLVDADAWTLL